MQRWSQSLWKYSDSIAHSSMEFGSSSGSHDERLLRPLLRRKQETPVRGVDVHMDPHANCLMMKFIGLRRFGGGSWGEGGVGVSALLSLSDEYEAPQTPSTPAPCM